MVVRRAWLLNLDADLELARGPSYRPTSNVRTAMAAHVEKLARALLDPGDRMVTAEDRPGSLAGFSGRAFCPTPSAIAALARLGATPEPHPPVDVLRRVNGRRFCASLGSCMDGAAFLEHEEDVRRWTGRPPPFGRGWRLKRAFGMAGRGQRSMTPGVMTRADEELVRAALAEDGIQVEPDVSVVREFGLHAVLREDGTRVDGDLVLQRCDARGQWLETLPATDADRAGPWMPLLLAERERVAAALSLVGYFGPFGIDAFVYLDGQGRERLQPRSEINARWSMGHAVGMAGRER